MQIAAPAPFGGLERVVQNLSRGLVRAGHDCHVAAVATGATEEAVDFVRPLEKAGVGVSVLEAGARGYLEERKAVARLC
ncbi:MAG: hypothetical protein R3191_02680, partial [Anaerolineales bacterium]|nr:hypothetical protein [Anaerolineales bacterium]